MDMLTTSVDVHTDMPSGLSENRLAAKALQLRLRRNVREADELIVNELRKKQAKTKDKGEGDAIYTHMRIATQEERCHFCFMNQSRPKHLTISIANFCYLMLPPWKPLVDGHCLIVPMQHEGASRNVDEDVWEEIRNYKKCLTNMFSKHNKDVLFMETAINLHSSVDIVLLSVYLYLQIQQNSLHFILKRPLMKQKMNGANMMPRN
ncbi:hypothetical protein KP509_26G021000 [Ceratopteris richardii]|uniref:Cwf19-like C-terminal domain-containing protein n=1 Tax=Ceratopteris richardii TaxID=49495 RepID=A0A8T2RLD1_CERRI|nr:hypothetical protein KP509_26G021000 [Ceratopteris richardii]